MANYAFLDENNIVVKVLSGIDEDDLDTLPEGFSSWEEWYGNLHGMTCKRTSVNTRFGKHKIEDPEQPGTGIMIDNPDQSKSLRKNFAGIGYKYDEELDAFIEPVIDASYESWVLDTTEGIYKPPVDYPDDGESYQWDESITNWKVQPPE